MNTPLIHKGVYTLRLASGQAPEEFEKLFVERVAKEQRKGT